jgi:hypothetical protein
MDKTNNTNKMNEMNEKLESTNWDYIEYLLQKLSCVCFLEDRNGVFKRRNKEIDDIDHFKVKVLIEEWSKVEEEEGEEDTEPDIFMGLVFTVVFNNDSHPLTIGQYEHPVFMPAIVKKTVVPTGGWQSNEFVFPCPNQLEVYDAEFLLEEELGVEVN